MRRSPAADRLEGNRPDGYAREPALRAVAHPSIIAAQRTTDAASPGDSARSLADGNRIDQRAVKALWESNVKIDEIGKVVSIVSVVVGLMISAAGYFANAKLQAVQDSIDKLKVANLDMDVSKKRYDVSARVTAEFSLPLARAFALQYAQNSSDKQRSDERILLPTDELDEDFRKVLSAWQNRRGLMTGKACEEEGLKARQVITLMVKNIGHPDAVDVTLKVLQKNSPVQDPTRGWEERSKTGKRVAYYDIDGSIEGWIMRDIAVGILRGLSSPESDRSARRIVLASVSGAMSLYGTVLVPVEISWTDDITKKRQTVSLWPQAAVLRAELTGAEIGSLGSTCRGHAQ